MVFHEGFSDSTNVVERGKRAALLNAKFNSDDDTYDTAVRNLQASEADNAAVWMEVLQEAAKKKDRAGVTAALNRMAHATMFTPTSHPCRSW